MRFVESSDISEVEDWEMLRDVDKLILQFENFILLSFILQISFINNFITYPLKDIATFFHVIFVISTIPKLFFQSSHYSYYSQYEEHIALGKNISSSCFYEVQIQLFQSFYCLTLKHYLNSLTLERNFKDDEYWRRRWRGNPRKRNKSKKMNLKKIVFL